MTFEKPRHSYLSQDADRETDACLSLNAIMAVAVTARTLRLNCQNQPSPTLSAGPGLDELTGLAAAAE